MITADDWRKDRIGVTRALFAPDGPLALLMTGYKPNPSQIAFAERAAATIERGEGDEARFTALQGGTGTGKTLGYLLPALMEAALAEGRILVATHTLQLQRQILSRDGQTAIAVVREATGREVTIAARQARSQFACPAKLARFIDELAEDGRAYDASLLASLLGFAEEAIADALAIETAGDAKANAIANFAADGRGLIEAWIGEDADRRSLIDGIARERIALDRDSASDWQAPWRLHHDGARPANCLVMTHASLIIDMQAFGVLTGAGKDPFALAIVDEADRLDEAARSALSTHVSVRGIEAKLRHLLTDLSRCESVDGPAQALADMIADAIVQIGALAETLQSSPAENAMVMTGREPWFADLRRLGEALDSIVRTSRQGASPVDQDNVDRVARQTAGLRQIFTAVADNHAGGTPVVDFSPTRNEPSLAIVPKRGARLVSRLWSFDQAFAKATLFTSATLATPGLTKPTLSDFIDMVGAARTPNRVNQDLSGIIEPKNFGKPSFAIAHPSAPLPNEEDGARTPRSGEWLAFAAAQIAAAADRPSRSGTCRCLVLATSFADAAALADALPERLGNRVIHRSETLSLPKALDAFKASTDGILITPGAWEGVDLPGLIDHLVVTRMPFSPPVKGDRLSAIFAVERNGETIVSRSLAKVLRMLMQGIGRAVRQAGDAPMIWLLDPRFGLTAAQQGRLAALPHPKASPLFLACVPARFHRALDRAEILMPQKWSLE